MPAKLEPGDWEGQYLDANGYQGRLRMRLDTVDDAQGTVRGDAELTLRAEDRPQIIRGQIEGQVEDEDDEQTRAGGQPADPGRGKGKGRLRLRLKVEGGPQGEIQYDARIRPAGSFAKQALFGFVDESPESNFGGGVWIAWRRDT